MRYFFSFYSDSGRIALQSILAHKLRAFLTRVTDQQNHADGGVAMSAAKHDSVGGHPASRNPPDRTQEQDELSTRRRHRADRAGGRA